jgi:uncharacterized membrane protein YhiD involved in acid resistance
LLWAAGIRTHMLVCVDYSGAFNAEM